MRLACVDATIEELNQVANELKHAECFVERVGETTWLTINFSEDSGVEFIKY